MTATLALDEETVRAAVGVVDDPEFPGVSVVELGLLETIDIDGTDVRVGLIPTFSGCPALEIIRDDVARSVASLPGVGRVDVVFLAAPAWTPARVSEAARHVLSDEFTVAVDITGRRTKCPRCGSGTTEVSAFGPTRCRSVSRCDACGEIVEVIR